MTKFKFLDNKSTINKEGRFMKKKIRKTKLPIKVLPICMIAAAAIVMVSEANAAGTAVQLDFVDNLTATVKEYMQGAASLVIDAIILAGGGWGSAKVSTPAPLIFAIISVLVFEICVKLIMK
jgi:hypothetical protein